MKFNLNKIFFKLKLFDSIFLNLIFYFILMNRLTLFIQKKITYNRLKIYNKSLNQIIKPIFI